MKKLAIGIAVYIVVLAIQCAYAANSKERSQLIIQNIRRHDATLPTNAQLDEIGMAFLYHPTSGPLITQYLEQQGLALNPDDETVLEDIGTLVGEVFTPASAAEINQYKSTIHRRKLREFHDNVLVAYRLRTAAAPALPIDDARDSVISTAKTDSAAIVGDNEDDPES